MKEFQGNPFTIRSKKEFDKLALKIFRYQFENQPTYQQFCSLLKRTPDVVKTVEQIPFLPISFFKSHHIITNDCEPEIVFSSSGTTQTGQSKHPVAKVDIYRESFLQAFQLQYGNPEDYIILALLPSYQERQDSSLIFMVNELMARSQQPESGYYLNRNQELIENLLAYDRSGKNVLLIGVTYALLDLIETQTFRLENTIIMETGGMKGRRKELVKSELHELLCTGFGVSNIHSEYGMTELLSQAYSLGQGIFECPPWMEVHIREVQDPLQLVPNGRTGGINVIDLANVYSCSFIATQDLGKKFENGSFEVLGRFDNADIRGCNLLVQ